MGRVQVLERRRHGPISVLTGGQGPALLLLHGIPGTARSWERVGTALTAHFQVIIPDMLGFGDSDPPSDGYYLDSQAAAVADLLAALDITELVVGGHDIGAPLAITLMRSCPHLRVRGLIVAAANLLSNVKITPLLRITQTRVLNELVIRLMIGNRLAHRVLYRTAVVNKASHPWSDHARHLTPSGAKYTRLLYQRTMLDFHPTYAPIEAFLPQITAPTLLLWGRGDPILKPSLGRKIQRMIEGSVLEIYDGTGHYVPEEQPGRVADDIIDRFCT